MKPSRIIVALLMFLFSNASIAQTSTCGTQPLPGHLYEELKQKAINESDFLLIRGSGTLRSVSLNINIMVYDNGPITTVAEVQEQIDTANIYFANAGIEFGICNVNYIINTDIFPFWNFQYEFQLGQVYDIPGCLNIYYVNYVVNASAYAYYPMIFSPDRIVMGQNLSGEVFAHELGHSFNLIHTHGNYGVGNGTDELVNGSNCTTAADLICDTPADPNLYVPGRVDSLCNYADTVTTDSLGFLYTPLTHNIMSYAPFNCYDMLTAGQYNRIAYTLAHERAYLKSGTQQTGTFTTPSYLCIYDSPIQLSATPPGGTFSGDGVTGSSFDPAAAGGGLHIITYNLPGTPPVVETTDAYYQYSDTSYSQMTGWQSVVAAADESLLAFSFYLKSPMAQDLYVTVYDSIGTAGIVLAEDTIFIAAGSVFNWNKMLLQIPVSLNAGNIYTIAVTASVSPCDFSGIKFNGYPAGQSNTPFDLSFITHVLPIVSFCGNSISAAINVSAPPEPVISNLMPVYCINAPAQPILSIPSGGISTINGIADSIINPQVLGAGTHTLHYTYTNAVGCSNDSVFTFIVNDTTAITNIPSVVCSGDSLLFLNGVPAGGDFYLDNVLLTPPQINPTALAPGQHTISYTADAEYPWLDTLDQSNLFTASNSSYSTSFNQTVWQSFTTGMKGYLNEIEFGIYLYDTNLVVFRLYDGEGTTGQLMYTDTVLYINYGTNIYSFPFPSFQLLLEKDSMYTFEMVLLPFVNNLFIYLDSNQYAGGRANFAIPGFLDADFSFATHVNSVYQCGADSVSVTFFAGTTPVINLGPDIVVPVGQNVVLSAGIGTGAFLWSTGETTGSISINGPPGSNLIWLQYINPDGCMATDTILVNFITGIEEEENSYFFIAPNPVNEVLYIQSAWPDAQITVMNSLGQKVYIFDEFKNQQGKFEINVSDLTPGVYTLHFNSKGKIQIKKFFKN